jgi:pimeloyl-ACP methyl ester carboxylesterase
VQDQRERKVNTPKGSIFVREVTGDDPAVVLMHGFPDDHRIYTKLISSLSPRRVVAFDWLGYGHSARSDTLGFTLEDHEAELTAVLDALEISRAVLVGHDASGPDAVWYSLAHPERVAGLGLLNTIFGRQKSLRMPEMTKLFSEPELATLADDLMADDNQRLWMLLRWGVQLELDASDPGNVAQQSILPQFLGSADQPDARAAIRGWTRVLPDSLDRQDALIEAGDIRDLELPVAVIFGERDRYLNPALAAELADLFSNASLHVLPGATHYVQDDQPDVVADLLKRSLP